MSSESLIVVIHISSSAVRAVIGDVYSENDIRIVGMSEVFTNSFYQGRIINHERLNSAIKQAIQEVEDSANCRIHSVWLSFATPEMQSCNSFGTVNINGNTISVRDVVAALSAAKKQDLVADHYLMQYLQQGVSIDNEPILVDNPIGSHAKQMTVMYHLMSLPVVSRRNMEELFRNTNVRIDHIVFDCVSSAEYSLIEEEKQQGVCFVDIGFGSTSICVYKEEKLVFSSCVAHGANDVTLDISAEMGVSIAEAERIKKSHGTVDVLSIDPGKFIAVSRKNSDDELTINLHELALIIEARYVEIFSAVFEKLIEKELIEYISSGVVLSGGGSFINGMVPFAKHLLKMPVFLTNPNTVINANRQFDDDKKFKRISSMIQQKGFRTALGTLIYSQSEQFQHSERSSIDSLSGFGKTAGLLNKLNDVLSKLI